MHLPWLTRKPVITIFHKFMKPPWGGGNQFLMALKKEMTNQGYNVTSYITSKTKVCIFNSFTFDQNLLSQVDTNKVVMVHRIDGPTQTVRGKDKNLDERIFQENKRYADITVFQSFWSLGETLKLGYSPINPIIISNAPDASIFTRRKTEVINKRSKVKLIYTSWSNNLRKGFDLMKKLDDSLDFNRYHFTFVGNSPYTFKHIRVMPPQSQKSLAQMLRQHDIFLMASRKEACSNALIEALTCGLPALYYNDASNPEIVGWGGLGFLTLSECLHQLEKLREDYSSFQRLINVPTIHQIAQSYLSLLNYQKDSS